MNNAMNAKITNPLTSIRTFETFARTTGREAPGGKSRIGTALSLIRSATPMKNN
jgi:hypothetical protein